MIPFDIQHKLKSQWGDKADSMDCFVQCRIYDPSSNWAWYIYAQNPDDEDQLFAIESTFEVIPDALLSMEFLESLFNHRGESMQFDHEFRPRKAGEIYKKLRS